jgi:hypothetical protein
MDFDTIGDYDLSGLGIDWGGLFKQGVDIGTGLDAQRRAQKVAEANARAAQAAAAQAAAEASRARTLALSNRPAGFDMKKVALYAGAAVVVSILAIKLLRRSKRR